MVRYIIDIGRLERVGVSGLVTTLEDDCYSGHGAGVNNPAMVAVSCVGPIVPGGYTMGCAIDTPLHGPVVIPLTPDATNEMYGRGDFLIHGDSIAHAGQQAASLGCIIADRATREELESAIQAGDNRLQVVVTSPTPRWAS